MKLEVGMYVRTKYNGIGKIVEYINDPTCYFFKCYKLDRDCSNCDEYITKADVIKEPSHNIIDLIEEHDYIRIITSAFFEPVYYSYGKLVIRDDIPIENYSNYFIAEVITHEQMESMSYKVGE